MKRFMVGFILLSFRAARPTIAGRVACVLVAMLLTCASSVNGQVIEEAGLPVKGNDVSRESFSLSCPSRFVARAGESLLLSCTATAVPEEGVRYEWESVSDDGLRFLSDAASPSPFFTAPVSGAGAEYAYRLTATGPGVYRTASVTVSVQGASVETAGEPGLQEDCDPLAIPEEPGQGCAEDRGPVPFGFGFEEEGGFLLPEAPGAPDRGGGTDLQAPPRLECPVAVFLEELETGAIECHAWDAAGEQYLEYSWEPTGNTTRAYLDNPRLIPEDSPTPSVVVPEMPAYETLESFLSGETTFRYRYRLTATSRATGLSSHEEVEVYVSSSRPVVYCPLEVAVEEGETVTLDCEGADPLSFRMDYDEEAASVLWEWEGLWGTSTAPLDATELSSPLFTAPVGSAGKEYHYIASMTSSASGVPRTARRRVTVRVVGAGETGQTLISPSEANAPSIECEEPADIYEATGDFTLDCTATEAPDGATYSWTGTDVADRLSATDVLTPMFLVPPDIDEPSDADKDYEYTVTMTAGGIEQASEDVTVTVLEKPDIYCTAPYGLHDGFSTRLISWTESHVIDFCPGGEYRGAPEGSEYVYNWRYVTAGCSNEIPCYEFMGVSETALLALGGAEHSKAATFRFPWNGIPWPPGGSGRGMAIGYKLDISAENADPLTPGERAVRLPPTIPKIRLEIDCFLTNYPPVQAGSPIDVDLECYVVSGAWPGYTTTWQWSPGTRLSSTDTPTTTFDVPDDVPRDTTYTYTVTLSAEGHVDGRKTVMIPVQTVNPAVACTTPDAVYEGSRGFPLDCTIRNAPQGVSYSWTGTDVANRLSATDVLSPTFNVPDDVSQDTTYTYTITATSANTPDAAATIAVRVLNRKLAVACRSQKRHWEVYEGSDDITLNCWAAGVGRGIVPDRTIAYAWTGTDVSNRLSATDVASPVFLVPDSVDSHTDYEYLLTATAAGAASTTERFTFRVLNAPDLSVSCIDNSYEVSERDPSFRFDCEASGAAPGTGYAYRWSVHGDTPDVAIRFLSAGFVRRPWFSPPEDVPRDTTYEYAVTASAARGSAVYNAGKAKVSVKVLNKPALSATCTNADREVYEGAADFELDCTASGAPSGSSYTYAWTGDQAAIALLNADDIASPIFDVPDEDTIDEDKSYEYTLTVSAEGAHGAILAVQVTVLNKEALRITCTNADEEVYEGAEDFALGCEASGAPSGSSYTYAWTGDAAAIALLSDRNIASPTFAVPDTASSDKTYEYTLTVSAPNADDGAAAVEVTVLNKKALIVVCTDMSPEVYEGSADFALGCEASGAPGDNPAYTYAWTGDSGVAISLLTFSIPDIASPTFAVPPAVDEDKTYKYTLTVSAQNAEDTAVEIVVTVLNKKTLSVFCAVPASVFEGSEDITFDCEASGAPGNNPVYAYAWTGGAEALALLDANDIASPTFAVPPAVDEDKTYEYTLMVSADNADTRSLDVTLKVLDGGTIALACTIPLSVYEGSEDVLFDCVGSGAPGEAPVYAYAWTGDSAALALLDANDIASPTFSTPPAVDEDKTYAYTLTVSSANVGDTRLDVAITVLNKRALSVVCADPGSIYEGSADITLDCEASGAPGDDPQYAYAWTASGDAPQGAAALLSATDIASPTFLVPDELSSTTTYEYLLTVSAANAEDTTLDVAITVLKRGALSITCTHADTEVYEGSEDFELGCSASGAPGNNPVYTYAWTADAAALALLSANDIASPTFAVPEAVSSDETYEYTLTVSAENVQATRLDVTITVLNKSALALVCTNAFAEVYEGAEDFELDCKASGAPGEAPEYTYAWTARGSTLDVLLLSATDIRAPLFHVPDAVSSDETYEYTLTVSAPNADDATVEIAVTVLNKQALLVFCAVPASVFEGSGEVFFDCSASGAPGINSDYAYAWTGDAQALALLDANDIASPTFYVPDAVDRDRTYEYTLTASTENADTGSLDITLKVLKRGALSIACSMPLSVFEGSGEVLFDCEASGAPGANPVYAYAWTGDAAALALLSARDIASPTFTVPDDVSGDERYSYTLTASTQNVEDARLDVAITVVNKRALAVGCADPGTVYEGSADITFDCEASGAPEDHAGLGAYTYVWTARGSTPDVSLLSAADIASPTFYVPEDVAATTTYEYLLTASANNADDNAAEVTVTVLNERQLALACAPPPSVYEGSGDVLFDCEASGASEGSAYEYVWTAWGDTPDVSLLSAMDIASPTFHVPENVDEDKTYEYLLTVSAENAKSVRARVTITVLNKSALALACAEAPSVYEGSGDVAFDCEASGAPDDDPRYIYVWTARGDTQDTALLSAADIASPTFHVPENVDEDKTYEYLLTASAQNADDATAEVSVTVLNKAALALACAAPAPVYEGSDDIILDCEASGAPGDDPQYAYVWTAIGDTPDVSLLSATAIESPIFYVPDEVIVTTTYEYLLTASAQNADDATAEVAVTVLDRGPLAFADDALAGRIFVFTVGERIEDILLPQATGGFPPYTYTLAPALPEGLALSDPARTISGTPLQVSPRTEYAWQAADANAGSVSLAFFVEVVPAAVPSPPAAESLSPDPEALALSGITTSVSPLRFGVQSADTEVALDPVTDRITTHISGPYHAGRLTLAADADEGPLAGDADEGPLAGDADEGPLAGDADEGPFAGDADEGPLAGDEEIALSVELVSPVLLRREGDEAEPVTLALSPSWSYTESCEGISSEALGGLYTELLLSEGDCPLLLFGGELDLAGALPGRYEGVMDVILRQGETEETRTLEVDVTVVSPRRTITIGPAGVRLDASREMPAGLTENQNLGIYPDIAFLNAGKPNEAFELSNPSLVPLEISVSARFGYTEAAENGGEIVVEDPADSDLGDLSSVVDIHPSVLVLMPGEKGLVRYGIREEVLASLTEKGYAAFFDIVSSPRRYADQDRMPEEVAGNRTARVTMRIPGVYVPGGGASRLQAELLSITEGITLSATFLVEALDGPFMGEVIAYDGEGRELGRREALVYTRSRVRVPLSQRPDEDAVFLRFVPRGAGRVPEPASIRWNAPPIDIGEARDKDGAATSQQALARKP